MRVLFIYRNPLLGFSIGKVFAPIEEEMRKYCEVDSLYMPAEGYGIRALWQNIRAVKKQLRAVKYDVIHITGVENYLLPFLRNYKTVVTVHDLGFYTNHNLPILKSLWKYFVWIYPIRLASKITFISDSSKDEAIKLMQLKPNQYTIILNPIDTTFKYTPKLFNKERPVILHLGTKDNKNLEGTILALSNINCHLRVIGKLTDKITNFLSDKKIEYSNVFNITNQQILEEYVNCDIVSMVSFYEGFGMPIIEGQSIGRVVVTSNLSPMNKIAKNSAILVDPYDICSMTNGYKEALVNSSHYIKKGLLNVKRFNLSLITTEYFNIYKQL